MACEVDPGMTIKAGTHARWYGAPPALFCGPRSLVPETPKWNYLYPICNAADGPRTSMGLEEYLSRYMSTGGSCQDYGDQKAGGWEFCNGGACPNQGGRTDVEGCCWWGRGVIQTSGVCNFGKLNYFLGAGAASDGRPALFPDVDFCKDPQAVCSEKHPSLKWISGMFFWMKEVQTYDQNGWNFRDKVVEWVDNGMQSPLTSEVITGASGIVNRGCPNPPSGPGCIPSLGEVHGLEERAQNFFTILKALGLL